MTKEEFLNSVEKIVISNSDNDSEKIMGVVKQYLNEAGGFVPHYILGDYLGEYFDDFERYFPSQKQLTEFWKLAGELNSVGLVSKLVEIQRNKVSFVNLQELITAGFYNGFEYVVYDYDLEDGHLYDLLEMIVFNFSILNHGKEILTYFLDVWDPVPLFQTSLNQLIYSALIGRPKKKAVDILLGYGADPFANYWDGMVDTGVPIIFKVVKNSIWNLRVLENFEAPVEKWNVIDEWGRNLLHYAIYDPYIYNMLLDKGVDSEHKALIKLEDNLKKLTLAKLNKTLPKEYGKSPAELVKF